MEEVLQFVDDKLRLVNKEGKLVDEKGRLLNENGRFINENNQFIDKDGNLVDLEGDYVVDFKPFLDDDGKPVVLDENKETKDEKNNDETIPSAKEAESSSSSS